MFITSVIHDLVTSNCEDKLYKRQKQLDFISSLALREKCSYSELFWSIFSGIWTENGEIICISLYSVRMSENTDQKISKYRHFFRSAVY